MLSSRRAKDTFSLEKEQESQRGGGEKERENVKGRDGWRVDRRTTGVQTGRQAADKMEMKEIVRKPCYILQI